MRLIGMLDSPFVRRVAISLNSTGLRYKHESVSVFRHFDAFGDINPVVKAPTLITDEGVVLMDSTLILEHIERLVAPDRRLSPETIEQHARSQRIIGLALAAAEKTVQIVYEYELRPEDKREQRWLDRIHGQLGHAYRLLEAEIGEGEGWLFGSRPMQADITAAVAWRFTAEIRPGTIAPDTHPRLARLSERAEALPEFLASPYDG